MPKHALVIFNPQAKPPVPVEEWKSQLVKTLNQQGECSVTFYPTKAETKPEDLVSLLQPPLDLIIAAGGDGTVRLALAALVQAQSHIPAAVIPFGTGNVLARNLGILQETILADPLEHAFDYILNGKPMRIDMGMMNGENFAAMAGIGPIAESFMKPDRAEKSSFKLIAYVKALLATIAMRPRIFKITTGNKTFNVQASGVFVTNVEEVGIGKPPDLKALADGCLHLHIVNPRQFADYVELGFRLTHSNRNDNPSEYALRVQDVFVEVLPKAGARSAFQKFVLNLKAFFTGRRPIESPRGNELPCMIDGEECGVAPMRVTLVSKVVNVLVPPAKHEEGASPKEAAMQT